MRLAITVDSGPYSTHSLSAIFEIALRQGEYVASHVLSPLRAFLPN